jgi:dihydrolipoamide dehydrogenase
MKHFDVVVLGAGSAGELISKKLAEAGKSVVLIEKLRVGGECAYVSCIPSKAMLRSAQVRNIAKDFVALGATSKPVALDDAHEAFRSAILRRDKIADNREDAEAAKSVVDSGVELIRGEGKFSAADRIVVNNQEITWTDMVISTGSSVSIPPIPGIAECDYWTSDAAYSKSEYPKSVLIGLSEDSPFFIVKILSSNSLGLPAPCLR